MRALVSHRQAALTGLLALVLLTPALRAEESPAAPASPSRITAVTVYPDRALVTREVRLNVQAGENAVRFEPLPESLWADSLRAEGAGTVAASILEVGAETKYVTETPHARIQDLERQIRGLQGQVQALDDQAKVLKQKQDFIEKIKIATLERAAEELKIQPPSVEDWQKLLGFMENNLTEILGGLRALEPQKADLRRQIEALQAELGGLRGGVARSFQVATVRLQAAAAGEYRVRLSYVVPEASWSASYDARLPEGERAVELAYHGIVRQSTGEDWENVALTLSTARPALGGAAPELNPWFLDVAHPVAPMVAGFRMQRDKAAADITFAGSMAMEMEAAAPPPPEVGASMAEAAVEAGATSATFAIAAAVSVKADGAPRKVGITTAKLPAKLTYQCVPKLNPTAFLRAEVTNDTEYPLLAGDLQIFQGGTFLASDRLKTVMPREKFDLALGADEGLAVKHRLVNRFEEITGLTQKTTKVTYEYAFSVTNNRGTLERIEIRDQVPISRHEKIVVKILAPDEKSAARQEDGKIAWTADLRPGAKFEGTLKFSVEYPSDLPVAW